jgi:adenine-specific DNA-methyltransferase
MEKLKMHSPDFVKENIARLAELFPNCVTESKAEDGSIKRTIDFDQLRQEMSGSIVEGPQERYQINWPGKREALLTANAPIAKTLRPCREESVDFDTTKNLFIEGDNLDALKLLQETYLGKVKMIYIDPPYNTGKDFIYEDDFSDNIEEYLFRSGQKDETGLQLVANTEANGRFHSDWLTMIYSRIKLSRNLLQDDGVIFISIDDGESNNLKSLCSEIFGEKNYLGTILWKKKTNGNNMGYIPPVHDYILCYAKNASENSILGFPLTDDYIRQNYSNPDNDPKGLWTTSDLSANHEGPLFEIINPKNGKSYMPAEGRYWVFNEAEVKRRIKAGRIIFGKTGDAGPIQKKYLNERESNRTKPESWWDGRGKNSDGTAELADLFVPKVFDHPKPTSLLKSIANISTKDNDLILDFFAGSGSMAHAVILQNFDDSFQRKYICVQLPEACGEKSIAAKKCGIKTIADLAKERIRRAGNKIKIDNAGKDGLDQLDIGFRVLKIDSSNMRDVYYTPDAIKQDDLLGQISNIREDRSSEDLIFQVLLDLGVDLSLPIAQETIDGKTVFFVNTDALAACFDTGINEDFIKTLAARQPQRVVFRDAGFKDSAIKINVEQIFKLLSPKTDVKCI